MKWNNYDFVLSADAQFNGSDIDYVPDLKVYAHSNLKSAYQSIVAKDIARLLHSSGRKYESASEETVRYVRSVDDCLHYPAEFYQSHLQKPNYYINYMGRDVEFMQHIRANNHIINHIYDEAFKTYYSSGVYIDKTIHNEVDKHFGNLDDQMKNIIKAYLTQKPLRSIFLIDVESAPASYNLLEPVYQTIKWHLCNFGIEHIISVSGKGYHFITQIPLYKKAYGLNDGKNDINYGMLNLMAIGGAIQAETMDKLVSTRWKSRKGYPTPLLAQRAYQGMWKLQQFFAVNIIDDIRKQLSKAGMKPWVNFTDSEKETVIIDLTGMLRQVDMGVFGSVGSIYSKSTQIPIVRIIRSRSGKEYFNNDLNWMLYTRSNLGAVKHHLVHSGGRISDGTKGIEKLIQAYNNSKIKYHLHQPCDRIMSAKKIRHIFESNYSDIRRRCPKILNDIAKAQPNFLNPKALNYVYRQMSKSNYSIFDMMVLTKSVYSDPTKKLDMDAKYSKDEWSRWPELLLGEWFKG